MQATLRSLEVDAQGEWMLIEYVSGESRQGTPEKMELEEGRMFTARAVTLSGDEAAAVVKEFS